MNKAKTLLKTFVTLAANPDFKNTFLQI